MVAAEHAPDGCDRARCLAATVSARCSTSSTCGSSLPGIHRAPAGTPAVPAGAPPRAARRPRADVHEARASALDRVPISCRRRTKPSCTRLQDSGAAPCRSPTSRRRSTRALGAVAARRVPRVRSRADRGASIGQVHAATLHDGTDVVVKVRRPRRRPSEIELDLEVLDASPGVATTSPFAAHGTTRSASSREFATTLRR